MVRRLNTTEALSWQTSAGFRFSLPIAAALHLHYSTMRGQHTALQMRNPVQNRPNGNSMGNAITLHSLCYQTPILSNAFCPFMTGFHQDYIAHTTRGFFPHLYCDFCQIPIFFNETLSVVYSPVDLHCVLM